MSMIMKAGKTMAGLAAAMRTEGIDVADHYDNEGSMYAPHSAVVFHGDDSTGVRAVEIAWEHGYEPEGLVRDWVIWGREIGEPDWVILFK